MSSVAESAPQSICILRLSAIGDVCQVVPVVRTLQSQSPHTRLTWVIGKPEAALVGDIAEVEFITLDKSDGWGAYKRLRARMRGRRFDVLLQMQASLRASLVSLCIPASVRLGFDWARSKDLHSLFINQRIRGEVRVHVLDSYFQFLEALGIRERVLRWDIPLSAADHAFAGSQLTPTRPLLVISPCSSQRWLHYRNWSAENYAAVVDYAAERHNAQVILTGASTALEIAYGQRICELTRTRPRNLIGQTTLKQLLALFARAAAVICPDSAPAHMATAVNTPVIAIYATGNPARTGPYFSQRWIVNKYPEAVRQQLGKSVDEIRWGRWVRNPAAMKLPQIADVTEKLDQLLE
jgi:heptosyltransferase I